MVATAPSPPEQLAAGGQQGASRVGRARPVVGVGVRESEEGRGRGGAWERTVSGIQ